MPFRIACRAQDDDKHNRDISTLLFHKGRLYSGGDDGKIKAWSPDLVKQAEVQAHGEPVFSITASDTNLYSSSSDGSIKIFDLNTLKEKQVLHKHETTEYWSVRYINGHLYVGDNEGDVLIYKGDRFFSTVNVAEPVKDMQIIEPYVLTIQDTDLVITEMKFKGDHIQWETDTSIAGRAPLATIGNNLIALIDRDGKEILLHSAHKKYGFKQITKIEHGSDNDRVINALAGVQWGDQQLLFSGGWDKVLKKWKVVDLGLSEDASINVDLVIDAIATGEPGSVYVGGTDGHITRVDF